MARLATRLPTLLLLGALLVVGGEARGQDLEPSLGRAARALAAEVARELPGRGTAIEGLVLVPGRGVSRGVLSEMARALLDDGFTVEVSRVPEPRPERVVFVVNARRTARTEGSLALETPGEDPWRLTRRFADADWVDEPTDEEIVVVGAFRQDPQEALLSARRKAWQRVIARLELPDEDAPKSSLLERLPVRTFLAEAAADGGPVYRCWFGVRLGDREQATILRATEHLRSSRRRAPWIRFGLGTGMGLLLLLGYLRTDLATRGYATGRLRLLFGTLFLIGLVVCWRAPL